MRSNILLFCFSDCAYLTPTEKEQHDALANELLPHKCVLYNQIVEHHEYNPHLIRCKECTYEGTDKEINTQAKELEAYSEIEGTEIGEACFHLLAIKRYPDYVSDKFYKALIKEIQKQLEYFQLNSYFVEKKETRTVKYSTLEWR